MAETVQSIATVEAVDTAEQAKPVAARRAARYWEVDAWRGTAVITMIIYHLGWDLAYFGVAGLTFYGVTHGGWYLLQRFTCISFITLAGLSVTLADRSLRRKYGPGHSTFPFFLRHGAIVFGWGMVITLVIWFSGVGRVDFGVLHLIGFSIIAVYPLRRFKWLNLALWFAFFVVGYFVQNTTVDTLWLVWLGFMPAYYPAVDYFPIIPWFGVALLGVFLGNLLYTEQGLIYPLPDWGNRGPVRFLRFLGRNSLVIYLTHQLVLFGALFVLFYVLGLVTF